MDKNGRELIPLLSTHTHTHKGGRKNRFSRRNEITVNEMDRWVPE